MRSRDATLGGRAHSRRYNQVMLARVQDAVARHRMCEPGERIGVACSGGADSVALLEALRALAPQLGITLGVVHLNHSLRGEASDEDAAFVRELAAKHGLEAFVKRVDVASQAAEQGWNLEEAGRGARYGWFGELIEQGAFDRIATGHTRSDQAETVLFRLLRGAGPDGLSAILPVREPGVIRPLIGVSRAEVEAFLAARGIPHRDDESNQDDRFARNRIRRDLLPRLEREWNPRAADALARLGDQAAEDAAYWEARLERWEARLLRTSSGGLVFEIEDLRRVEPALRRRLLRRALERIGGVGRYDFQHVEALRGMVERPDSGARLSLPGLTAERSCGRVRFGSEARPAAEPAVLEPPGEREAPDGRTRIRVEIEPRGAAPGSYTKPNWDRVDWLRAAKPLVLRGWRPGDRIRMSEGGEPRKLSDLLQGSAVSRWDRDRWPVLAPLGSGAASDDRIVWARGFGVSLDLRPVGNIREALRVFEFDEVGRSWTGPERWETITARL